MKLYSMFVDTSMILQREKHSSKFAKIHNSRLFHPKTKQKFMKYLFHILFMNMSYNEFTNLTRGGKGVSPFCNLRHDPLQYHIALSQLHLCLGTHLQSAITIGNLAV